MMEAIEAYVECIQGLTDKVRISAGYESAKTISSITFDVPFAEAANYWIGQKLVITIRKA